MSTDAGSAAPGSTAPGPELPAIDGPALLLLDFDGTLAPIAPHPSKVRVHEEVAPLMEALADRGDAVWVVTGRRAQEVLGYLPHARVVGLHGLEWPGDAAPEPHPLLEEARARLQRVVDAHPGSWIEDKGAGLCYHVRPLDEDRWPVALDDARALLTEVVAKTDDLTLLDGHAVLEIRPRAASKANAVRALVARHPGHTPIYVGDDVTDEEAFSALPKGGFGVRVAPEGTPTRAAVRVDDVDAVADLLRRLLDR